MKKLLTLTLTLLLSFSIVGCGEKTNTSAFKDMLPVSTDMKDYLFFADSRWGMDVTETCNALKLNKEKLVEKEINTARLPLLPENTTSYSYSDYKYFEQDCDLILTFNERNKLIETSLIFHNEAGYKQVMLDLAEEIGSEPTSFDRDGKMTGYLSNKRIEDVLSEEQASAFSKEMALKEISAAEERYSSNESINEKAKESLIRSLSRQYPQKNISRIVCNSLDIEKNVIRFCNVGYILANEYLSTQN